MLSHRATEEGLPPRPLDELRPRACGVGYNSRPFDVATASARVDTPSLW
jgi:hypothetical protein